jgi:hypothetical protein
MEGVQSNSRDTEQSDGLNSLRDWLTWYKLAVKRCVHLLATVKPTYGTASPKVYVRALMTTPRACGPESLQSFSYGIHLPSLLDVQSVAWRGCARRRRPTQSLPSSRLVGILTQFSVGANRRYQECDKRGRCHHQRQDARASYM